jgi:hypothetical protein
LAHQFAQARMVELFDGLDKVALGGIAVAAFRTLLHDDQVVVRVERERALLMMQRALMIMLENVA